MGFGRWAERDANPYSDRTIGGDSTNGFPLKVVYTRYRTGSISPVWVKGDIPASDPANNSGVFGPPNLIFLNARNDSIDPAAIPAGGQNFFNPFKSVPTNITTGTNNNYVETTPEEKRYLLEIVFNKLVKIKKVILYNSANVSNQLPARFSMGRSINTGSNPYTITDFYTYTPSASTVNIDYVTTGLTSSSTSFTITLDANSNNFYVDKIYIIIGTTSTQEYQANGSGIVFYGE